MAHMIPSEPKEFDERSHEGIVFEALKKLPDNYYVFHSVETLSITDSNIMTTKETDFLVVNQRLGVLTIEVKAGDGIFFEDGQWHYTSGRIMPHGGPYKQARIASATLRNLVKYHADPAVTNMHNHIKFASAVWFPDMPQCRINRIPFGSDSNRKITLSYDDLANPRPAIERILAIEIPVGNRLIENRMTGNDLKLLIDHVICPKFHLIKMPFVEHGLMEMRFNMLLKEQYKILDFLDEQPIAVINGAAGTGKTMVAVEKARRHSAQGDRVLFLCFNRMLRDYLDQQYKDRQLKKDFENVDFLIY